MAGLPARVWTGSEWAPIAVAQLVDSEALTAATAAATSATAAAVEFRQYGADGSVLQNLPVRVHPAERLLKQAVWWIDAAHSSASGQAVTNLGWGGSALNAQVGSTTGADSNDPKYLDWTGENYVWVSGVGANHVTTPDAAALDLTGDLTLTARIAADDWTPAATMGVINKGYNTAYELQILITTGVLRLGWHNGTTYVSADSTVAPTVADGAALWVRATLDVDNGAGAYEVKFYTAADSPDLPTSWTQLGSTVTGGTTTAVAADANPLSLGGYNGVTPFAGKIHRAIVASGLHTASVPVLDIDCSDIASGAATSFTARTGQTVTINRSTSGRKAVAVTHPVWLFGTDDYMQVADNDLIDFGASDSFTVLAVVRQWDAQSGLRLVVNKFSGPAVSGYGALADVGGALNSGVYINDGTSTAQVYAAPTTGALNVSGGIVDRATQLAYRVVGGDVGASVSTTAIGSLANSAPLLVGKRTDSVYADMEFVAAAIFRRALTSDEISTLAAYFQGRAI